jgi:putative membrane protein
MDVLRNRLGKRELLIGALVVSALSGCAISRKQPPAANANIVAVPATAQPTAQKVKASRTRVTRAAPSSEASSKKKTAVILAQIHHANLKEIAIGMMAEGKVSNSEVRAYADQLVQDHTNADQMVVATAQKTGAHLHDSAAGPQEDRHEGVHGKLVDQKLNSASGTGFDRLFLQQTSSDNERLIRTLQQEREDASDDEIEALIDKMIPILEQHRELAQILMKKEQA